MAIETISKLLENDTNVIEYYQNAIKLWGEIWKSHKSLNEDDLSELLHSYQLTFEHKCGGKHLGQEIMVWTGFGILYDKYAGFGENKQKAIILRNAFNKSSCSFEVISRVNEVVKIYYLED